jgi:hypothetical protein
MAQAERVEQAVQAAVDAAREDGKRIQLVTADDAIGYVEGYEPSANETKLFRKAWNARQLAVDDEDDLVDAEDVEEFEAAEADDEDDDSADVETIDPFAGDDEEVPEAPKMDDRRAVAVVRARELLGDDADTAAAEEAILALRHDGHEFYAVMRSSQAQATKFMRDFRKTQPGNSGSTSARLSKAIGFQEDLQKMRSNLSTVRKTTEKGEAKRLLEEVKEQADAIILKVDASENA